ncbi:unnamed protein product [Lymnaea stagnalis]|uniref:Zinc phosphodiesterase ELAC protein 1 n=1 Tax=Lymnaea stagnalis TaxID=6523 RepID=A0AAV2HDN1_LYMST
MDVLELTFLGTASAVPTLIRCVSCTALRHDEGIWLFDCGEGSQIQLMKSLLKPGKINKIFITHLHGDHLFGLPGLLCTISQNNQRDAPVEIYGPLGLRHYLNTALCHSRSDICFQFVIHELQPLPFQLPDNIEEWPLQNDMTAPFHPKECPGSIIIPDENQLWHLYSDSKLSVKAVWVKHRVPSFSFIIKESGKTGKLDAQKLKSLGVSPGPLYARLKAGETVVTESGTTILPSDVVGDSIPGRTIVISGDSSDSSQLHKLANGATVLVHEATLENSLRDQCVQNGHSTPEMTASLAKSLDVKLLILNHVSSRYKPVSAKLSDDEKSAQILLDEALDILPAHKVLLAEDLFVYNVSR